MKKYMLLLCVVLMCVMSAACVVSAEQEKTSETENSSDPYAFLDNVFFPAETTEKDLMNAFEPYENENEKLQVNLRGDSIENTFKLNLDYEKKNPDQYAAEIGYYYYSDRTQFWSYNLWFGPENAETAPDMVYRKILRSGLFSNDEIDRGLIEYYKENNGRKSFVASKEELYFLDDVFVFNPEFKDAMVDQTFTINNKYLVEFWKDDVCSGSFWVYDGDRQGRNIYVTLICTP